MKRIFLVLTLALMQTALWAVPAKRGVWKDIKLADGTTVHVALRGDEFRSYWQAEDGRCFVKDAEQQCYVLTDIATILAEGRDARAKAPALLPSRVSIGGSHPAFVGSRKGVIILVEFTDCKFQSGHDAKYYSGVANELTDKHKQDGFVGSIHDYFYDQSYGKFDLTFDVIGPISLKYNQAYYGGHEGNANDKNVPAMVIEAIQGAANLKPDFSEYDWFGDGYVDQVFIIYAGRGEASGGGDNTIWPHRSSLTYARTIGGKKVQVYACSNEMQSDDKIDGIGPFCHEFSHCLGLADLYDTSGGDNYGMGQWDVMEAGNYLGESFRPCGYSGFERNYCGWKTPIVLTDDADITGMKGIAEDGDYYMIFNDNYDNEYYILENRNQVGWDKELFNSGLLITHIDFDKSIWASNSVNASNNKDGHEHYSLFQADNDPTFSYNRIAGDVYPYRANNKLTNTSVPAAELYHPNSVGEYYMSKPITGIVRHDDGTISFKFRNEVGKEPEEQKGLLFSETFEYSNGIGGNDGTWKAGNASFVPDNDGWESAKAYGGAQCAIFGTSLSAGKAITPIITIEGEATLSFLAAPVTKEAKSITLSINSGDATLSETTFDLAADQWTNCSTKLTGTGEVSIQFKSNSKRFFLDEVMVTTSEYDAIDTPSATHVNKRMYNLMGQPVDNKYRGLVISNGKKLIIK